MGLCGYNEKIGAGVLALVDGMIQAMVTKELARTDFRLTLLIELEELRVSNDSLAARPDSLGHLDGFIAINRFAQVLFERAFAQLSKSGNWTSSEFALICKAEAAALVDAMREIDRSHRSIKATRGRGHSDTLAISAAIAEFIDSNHHTNHEIEPFGIGNQGYA